MENAGWDATEFVLFCFKTEIAKPGTTFFVPFIFVIRGGSSILWMCTHTQCLLKSQFKSLKSLNLVLIKRETEHEASEVIGGKIKKIMLKEARERTLISVQWRNVKNSEKNQRFSRVWLKKKTQILTLQKSVVWETDLAFSGRALFLKL